MGGLYRLFLRITPIITLICFICFGITHTFQQQNQQPLTYLSTEEVQYTIYTRDPNTQEYIQETETQEIYTFDMTSYVNNLNQNILKRATNNIFDLTAYKKTLDTFDNIWKDGYQFGDGVQTIINTGILIVNTIITIINVVITPLRLIAGIILTGLSVMGININRQTPFITAMNAILDNANIKYLKPTWNDENPPTLNDTKWIWNLHQDSIRDAFAHNQRLDCNFSDGIGNYIGIWFFTDERIGYIWVDANNQEQTTFIYNNGWINYNQYNTIYTGNNNNLTDEQLNKWYSIMPYRATQQTDYTP